MKTGILRTKVKLEINGWKITTRKHDEYLDHSCLNRIVECADESVYFYTLDQIGFDKMIMEAKSHIESLNQKKDWELVLEAWKHI